jgi:hypothetical protein
MDRLYEAGADAVVLLHVGFVLFAVFGGWLVRRRPRLAWVHLPALLWAGAVEFAGWICPLTPLEDWLRVRGGGTGYRGDFIAHYLLPVLYPAGLTRSVQLLLGLLLLLFNAGAYAWVLRSKRRNGEKPSGRGG